LEKIMRKLLLVTAVALGAFAFAPVSSASAVMPVQAGIADAAATVSDTIQVKRKKSARPHGWSRGRKVGWRGGSKPPGQRR
jgi:hypothetical protein